MWFTRQADGYRAWFVLASSKGALITGAVGGDFTVTVVDPPDSTSSTLTVSESTQKSGLYTFLIPSAFITTNGIGSYGVVIEVAKTTSVKIDDVLSANLKVSAEDFDSIVAGQAAIPAAVWAEVIDGTTTAGTIMGRVNAWVRGKVTLAGTLATYFAENGVTALFKNNQTPTERTPTP